MHELGNTLRDMYMDSFEYDPVITVLATLGFLLLPALAVYLVLKNK